MEWLCLCVRGGLARGEGNGEIGDNAESYCTESFWPSSHSHPICHHNLFIRHSAGTFSEMQLLIMHVDLKWNWERGAWKRLRDIENTSASVFFYTQLALLIKSQNTVPVWGMCFILEHEIGEGQSLNCFNCHRFALVGQQRRLTAQQHRVRCTTDSKLEKKKKK